MTETALGFVKAGSFQVPAIIADIGPEATSRYFEFFSVPIRNKNTRIAYYHAIGQFLDWCQCAGFRDLKDIEPIRVAAYVEQHPGSPATIKQHMSAIRMLFSWLAEKGDIGSHKSANRTPLSDCGQQDAKAREPPGDSNRSARMLKRRLKDAGLSDAFSPHSFRATGITNFLENGGTLEVAQRIAGHADSRTTKLYDRRGQRVLVEDMERIRY